MEGLFSRYRNLSLLVLLLAGQLLLLAWQIKSKGETRLIRVWAVTAVTPIARGLDAARGVVMAAAERVTMANRIADENARLRQQAQQTAVRIQLLEERIQQGDRAKALLEFRATLGGKSVPARILGIAPGVQSGVLFI